MIVVVFVVIAIVKHFETPIEQNPYSITNIMINVSPCNELKLVDWKRKNDTNKSSRQQQPAMVTNQFDINANLRGVGAVGDGYRPFFTREFIRDQIKQN